MYVPAYSSPGYEHPRRALVANRPSIVACAALGQQQQPIKPRQPHRVCGCKAVRSEATLARLTS